MQVFACIYSSGLRRISPGSYDLKFNHGNQSQWCRSFCYKELNIDKVFKALADPSRRKLLDQLHQDNGQTLTALCEHMNMSRQAVTQHLQLLEEANLVVIVWQGREKLHYLNPVPLQEIYHRWIEKFERNRLTMLRNLKKKLEEENHEKT